MKVEFLATVNMGLEKIAAHEVSDLLRVNVIQGHGSISFIADIDAIFYLNTYSRTINKLILTIIKATFEDLQDLYKIASFPNYTNYIERNQSFAVRVERFGKHNFSSVEAAARIGQGIIDSYLSDTGQRLKVNLDFPDIEFITRIIDDNVVIGINTTGISLHKRGYKKYKHHSGLSPTIAASMIYLSEWNQDELLLDPMCGGGTIPIEAALMSIKAPLFIHREKSGIRYAFEKFSFIDLEKYESLKRKAIESIAHKVIRILASDISKRHVIGAKFNSKIANLNEQIDFFVANAVNMDRSLSRIDKVVTNPPYGKRSADLSYIKKLYEQFLSALNKADIKTAIIITAAPKILKQNILKNNFYIDEEIKTFNGGLITKIFKIRKA
ncbi:MAG TPA: tRNA (guanine(6)-N2)-methyltransferase [Geobacterales bacterium]|nr:tRNA (guanine(6)-N2)-methyltransferase [Geobacterales bacterium]